MQSIKNNQNNFKKKSKVGELTLHDFQNDYKGTGIEATEC